MTAASAYCGVLGHHRPEAVEDLANCLVELGFAGVAAQHLVVDVVQLFVQAGHRVPFLSGHSGWCCRSSGSRGQVPAVRCEGCGAWLVVGACVGGR